MPNRVSVWIVLFLVFFNAGYGMMGAMGVWDHMGTDPEPGGDELDDLKDSQRPDEVNPQGGGLSTLFGLIASLYDSTVGAVLSAIFPGIDMLGNLDIMPAGVVEFLKWAGLIATIDAAAYLRGFNL